MGTVDAETLVEYVLAVPSHKSQELRQSYPNEEDYMKQGVLWYLMVSPYASWEHVGGGLLINGEDDALSRVKEHIKREQGMHL